MRPDHEGLVKLRSVDFYPEGGELHRRVSNGDEATLFALNDWLPFTETENPESQSVWVMKNSVL